MMEDILRQALERIFGAVPDETWRQVAAGEIVPPWPLPDVMRRMGLKPRGSRFS